MNLIVLLTYFPAYVVVRFFLRRDPGEQEKKQHISKAIYFGLVALVMVVLLGFFLEQIFFEDISDLENKFLLQLDTRLALNVAMNATIEEISKSLPFAFYIYKKDYFNEITDGIIYFAIVGLTFGAIETSIYSLLDGGALTVVYRFAIGLFFHGALASIVGYAVAHQKMTKQTPVLAVVAALIVVSGLHTIYNIGVNLAATTNTYWIFLPTAISLCSSALMFALFYKACKQDYESGRTYLLPKKYQNRLN